MTIKHPFNLQHLWQFALLAAATAFLYASVIVRLVRFWWVDENYSHGLLVVPLIGYLIWLNRETLLSIKPRAAWATGAAVCALAMLMLFVGTVGAELFVARTSLVVMLTGFVLYFFGWQTLRHFVVPLTLLVLAIPIPAILWNQIAFPLQLFASQVAIDGLRLFAIPALRFGNVIELLPVGASQPIQLEVVEACSGIRSLMTLITLALVYAYFTALPAAKRTNAETMGDGFLSGLRSYNFWRAVLLMLMAIPIAIVTNAVRVTAMGLLAYYYGKQVAEEFLHDFSGWFVYVTAIALLVLVAWVIDRGYAAFTGKSVAE